MDRLVFHLFVPHHRVASWRKIKIFLKFFCKIFLFSFFFFDLRCVKVWSIIRENDRCTVGIETFLEFQTSSFFPIFDRFFYCCDPRWIFVYEKFFCRPKFFIRSIISIIFLRSINKKCIWNSELWKIFRIPRKSPVWPSAKTPNPELVQMQNWGSESRPYATCRFLKEIVHFFSGEKCKIAHRMIIMYYY